MFVGKKLKFESGLVVGAGGWTYSSTGHSETRQFAGQAVFSVPSLQELVPELCFGLIFVVMEKNMNQPGFENEAENEAEKRFKTLSKRRISYELLRKAG